jgi:CAAX protease family protein
MAQVPKFKIRNPWLVLVWTFGLFIFVQLHQYVGVWFSSLLSGASFEAIINGDYRDHNCVLGQGIAALVVGVPLVYLAVKYLWRRDCDWMRLRFSPKLFLSGLALGTILPFCALAIIYFFGEVEITGTPVRLGVEELYSIIFGSLSYVLFVALAEEIVFRGMVAREWAVKWGWTIAAVLGGIYFGALHLLPILGKASVSNILLVLVAAVAVTFLFVALYIRSGSLWLPIGFHAAWNFTLQTLIGTTMSGHDSEFGLFQTELSGPDFLTGGEFGLESSAGTIGLYAIVALLLIFWSKKGRPELLDARPATATTPELS